MLSLHVPDNRPLLTFQSDGTLIVADHVKPDEAGRLALQAMCETFANMIAVAKEAEREACARVADQKAKDYLSPEYATGQPLSSFAERFACKQIAEAIRART